MSPSAISGDARPPRHRLDAADHVGIARRGPGVGQAEVRGDGPRRPGEVERLGNPMLRRHAQRHHVVDAGRGDSARVFGRAARTSRRLVIGGDLSLARAASSHGGGSSSGSRLGARPQIPTSSQVFEIVD